MVLSATGRMPSLGNSTAAVPAEHRRRRWRRRRHDRRRRSARSAAPPKKGDDKKGGGKGDADAPTLSPLPKTVKASALAKGLPITVKVAKAGQVTAVGKVGAQVVAKGGAKAKRAGKVTLRLKATRAWSKRLGQLTGKKLKVTVTAPGGTARLTRTLG